MVHILNKNRVLPSRSGFNKIEFQHLNQFASNWKFCNIIVEVKELFFRQSDAISLIIDTEGRKVLQWKKSRGVLSGKLSTAVWYKIGQCETVGAKIKLVKGNGIDNASEIY
jgi:hypothetical protein